MKLTTLSLLGSVLLGAAAAFAMFSSQQATAEKGVAPQAPSTILARDLLQPSPQSDDLLAKLYADEPTEVVFDLLGMEIPELEDLDLAAPAPKIVNCGDALPVATPDAGVSGQGCGATEAEAIMAAVIDGLKKLMAYSKAKCTACPDPNQCHLFISLLTDAYEIETYQTDGIWCAVARYKGPYLAACSPCNF